MSNMFCQLEEEIMIKIINYLQNSFQRRRTNDLPAAKKLKKRVKKPSCWHQRQAQQPF